MNILVLQTQNKINNDIANDLLEKGHEINKVDDIIKYSENEILELSLFNNYYDLVIVGIIDSDEEMRLKNDYYDYCNNHMLKFFENIFLIIQRLSLSMIRKKKGNIVFLNKYDAMRFNGLTDTPISNNLSISFMKSLNRELSSFKVSVNTVTLGTGFFFDENGKELSKLFSLKPRRYRVNSVSNLLECLFLLSDAVLGGQNIELSPGTETSI